MIRKSNQNSRIALLAATVIAGWGFVGTAVAQTGANWLESGGVPQGTRFSTLSDVTAANVGGLVEEFAIPTGSVGAHEGGPLVVGNIMYVVTPFPNKLIALDLANAGKVLWTYAPAESRSGAGHNGRANRGASYANGMVVFCELDGHVSAVNATTGKVVWRTQVTDPNVTQETLPIAPIVVNGKVIIGDSLSEMGARGVVRALSLATGKLVWQAYNTGPDSEVLIDKNTKPYYAKDQGANLGATTWPGQSWQVGGATVWEWMTYDKGTNLLFYGTAQPGTFNADQRPGDNKWGDSVFARNPDTGKVVWVYQLTPNDHWDFDATNEYTVVDLKIAGALRKTLVHFSKNGFAYVFDRTNGQLISATPYSDGTNWAKSVDLTSGLPNIDNTKLTHQGQTASGLCPSALGGKDWEYSSYSPKTGLFYFGLNNFCMHFQPLLTQHFPHAPYFGVGTLSFDPSPNFNGALGALVAWDPVKAKAVWSVPETLPLVGPGTLATAGGLVFYGTSDSHFKALDASSGKVLWTTTLECPVVSNPIAYTGPDGKERVAVYSGSASCPVSSIIGGNSMHPSLKALYDSVPNLRQPNAAVKSGYVHVFKLP